jgi:Gas vesicle synthesis protein GvpL/GvpF
MQAGGLEGAVYVYGVSAHDGYKPITALGVQDEKVWPIEFDGLVALASAMHDASLAAKDVRAHWRVVEQAFEQSTVLPFRLGTVLESEQAVREQVLEPNAEHLSHQLQQMAGLTQLNVKGRYDEDRLLRDIVHSNPAVAKLRERVFAGASQSPSHAGQIELGRLVERAVGERRAHDGAVARRLLEPHAVATQEEEVAHPNAFNIAFLVDRQAVDKFSGAVGGLREELGDRIEIRYVGPMPPYSFADAGLLDGVK